jgi:hypothetical protein
MFCHVAEDPWYEWLIFEVYRIYIWLMLGMCKNHSELLDFWTLSIVQYSKKLENTKGDLIQSLQNRASTIHQERQDLVNEISSLRCDLQFNSYHQV